MKKPVLQAIDLRKSYGSAFCLEAINLELFPGEILALIGQNGCGKSALLKILSGLVVPDSGIIDPGRSSSGQNQTGKYLETGIILQPQELEDFGNLSVAENIFMGRLPRRRFLPFLLDSGALHRACVEVFDRFGIKLDPSTRVSMLGYAQRLLVSVLGTCLSGNPVILLDEPTAGMNEPERNALFRLLKELKSRGTSVVLVTHRLDELPQIADRVAVMQAGQLIANLSLKDADKTSLLELMTGRLCPQRYPRTPTVPGPIRLEAKNLRSGQALDSVSFTVKAGEVVGITGLMGSGRTRLASCLFGAIKPDRGEIHIDQDAVFFKHPGEALNRGMALIPEDRQEEGIFYQLDLVRNMTSAALGRFRQGVGLDEHYMAELAAKYVQSLDIKPGKSSAPISHFSGGNQQKIMVARWLMSMAHIYILDEPTRGIDAAARIDIYNAMNDLVSKGTAMLLISSDIEELLGMCDRILILKEGRISHTFARDEVSKADLLGAMEDG